MSYDYPRPNLILSRCLELKSCRYNGHMIRDQVVAALLPYINVIPVCPEEEIGLGTPRDPIRIVRDGQGNKLIQPATGSDITERMEQFANCYVSDLKDLDGAILKSRSPSCGIRDTKIYPKAEESTTSGRGAGFFARQVRQQFPNFPIADEGRLASAAWREHFLTAIFTLARFHAETVADDISSLIEFQSRHKLLFMTYNQTRTRRLGRIVANQGRLPAQEVHDAYAVELPLIFARRPRPAAHINTQMHAFGFFSGKLTNLDYSPRITQINTKVKETNDYKK